MFSHKILIAIAAFAVGPSCVVLAAAQQATPPVKVNVLNVCAPSDEEQKEISSALAKIPSKPAFSKDYEVSRGHSTLDSSTPIPGMQPMPPGAVSSADWVRVRREFPSGAFSNVQYSFSVDATTMVETLVLHVRDAKELIQVSIEDSASAVTSPTAMLSTSTPPSRVKLERFGKASVVLARCSGEEGGPVKDQSAYEPIFHSASSIMESYRDALGARKMVPRELGLMGVGVPPKTAAKATGGGKKNP